MGSSKGKRTWFDSVVVIIRVSKFMLTGFLRPGNHTFRTFEHDCSTQILPEYSDLVLFLRFVCLFFLMYRKTKKIKNVILSLFCLLKYNI